MSSTENTRAAGERAQAFEQERRLALGIDPSPEDIALECERIQATWSRRERRRRAGLPKKLILYEIPEVELLGPELLEERHYRHLDY
jgi:hypothetical protein